MGKVDLMKTLRKIVDLKFKKRHRWWPSPDATEILVKQTAT